MSATMTLSLASLRASQPVAHLGQSHGYCFDGDLAHLNAEILCDESRLCGQLWALQLWTDEGIRIAELPLGQLAINGSGYHNISGSTTACPPASAGPHIISMLLVSQLPGEEPAIEDGASYPQPASFIQPRLQGTVCSGFDEGMIRFEIARIANPRPADNISGTLALELWALDQPYTGGAWSGTPVASLVLGTLAGEDAWQDCQYTVPAGPLPASGHLTLMLREWTPAGYLTRDYRSLTRPTVSASATPTADDSAKGKPDNASPKEAKPVPTPSAEHTVSINNASAKELAAVKGISKPLAAAIVAARPYAKLEDVIRAKGMGQKLLEKLRAALTL